MLSNLILSLAISFAVGLNGITKNENNNFNNNNNVNNVNHTINNKVDTSESSSEISYPIYDDVNSTITLSQYQLNNYTFENFYNYVHNQGSYTDITPFNIGSSYDDDVVDEIGAWGWYDNEGNGIYFIYDYSTFVSAYTSNYIFGNTENAPFQNVLNLQYSDETEYHNFKVAIQNDILANEQTGTMGDNIIDAITSGLGLIGDLAREFLTGFGTLFWDATANNNAGALTPFGQFALVMLGVAITMAVISLVLALIKGNTGA